MKVNIQETGHHLRLNNMRPGVLFSLREKLYIRTDSTSDYHVKCVDVVYGKLVPINRNEICQVRNDLHITNVEVKDED